MRYALLLTITMLLLAACTNNGGTPGYGYSSGWLPFIESIEVPAQVMVGDAAVVRLTLSTQRKPELLTSGGFQVNYIPSHFGDHRRSTQLWIGADQQPPFTSTPARHTVEIELSPYNQPGEYELDFTAARTREFGGTSIKVMTIPWISIGDPERNNKIGTQSVTLTVVPAPQ